MNFYAYNKLTLSLFIIVLAGISYQTIFNITFNRNNYNPSHLKDTIGWNLYTNQKVGFSIKYPPGSTIQEPSVQIPGVKLLVNNGSLTIFKSLTFDTIDLEKDVKMRSPGVSYQKVEINGFPALAEHVQLGKGMRRDRYFWLRAKEGNTFSINRDSGASWNISTLRTLDLMITTFKEL